MVQLSTVPTKIDDCLAPRHVDLRPFAVNDGDQVWVLPGGFDAGCAAGRVTGGQLQPGWRVQGHLGAGVAHVGGRPPNHEFAAERVRSLPKPASPPYGEEDANGAP